MASYFEYPVVAFRITYFGMRMPQIYQFTKLNKYAEISKFGVLMNSGKNYLKLRIFLAYIGGICSRMGY